MEPRLEIVTMNLCHTQCIFCKKDCYHQTILISDCGHSFCVGCSIHFYEDLHLSQEFYGCPPCPNGCKNPKSGFQCYCEEYDPIKNHWIKTNPSQYHQWVAEETLYKYKYNYKDKNDIATAFNCPVCISSLFLSENEKDNDKE